MSERANYEQKLHDLHDKATRLNQALHALSEGVFPIEPIPADTPETVVRRIIGNRSLQLNALQLGVAVKPNDRNSSVEVKIFDALPGILETKGLIEGVTFYTNYGSRPAAPHQLVRTVSIEVPDIVRVLPLDGQAEHDYGAIMLALYATLEPPTTPIEAK